MPWLYDFGNVTSTQLGTSVSALETKINAARTAAQTMINGGTLGSTSGTYRVIIRSDGNVPAGYTIEIRAVI